MSRMSRMSRMGHMLGGPLAILGWEMLVFDRTEFPPPGEAHEGLAEGRKQIGHGCIPDPRTCGGSHTPNCSRPSLDLLAIDAAYTIVSSPGLPNLDPSLAIVMLLAALKILCV